MRRLVLQPVGFLANVVKRRGRTHKVLAWVVIAKDGGAVAVELISKLRGSGFM